MIKDDIRGEKKNSALKSFKAQRTAQMATMTSALHGAPFAKMGVMGGAAVLGFALGFRFAPHIDSARKTFQTKCFDALDTIDKKDVVATVFRSPVLEISAILCDDISPDTFVTVILGFALGFYLVPTVYEHLTAEESMYFVQKQETLYPLNADDVSVLKDLFGLRKRNDVSSKIKAKCIYFPADWTFASQEILALRNCMNTAHFDRSLISACIINHDALACKASLVQSVGQHFGPEGMKYLPRSWTLDEWSKDYTALMARKEITHYIAKTNQQRQCATTLFSSSNMPSPTELAKSGAVIIQEMLPEPLCILNRKTTLRVYLLIVITRNRRAVYRYSDGFVYYGNAPYEKGSNDPKIEVASGYIDRKVYDTRPLTVHDLWQSMSRDDADMYSHAIDMSLQNTVGNLVHNTSLLSGTPCGAFQLFGCDVFLRAKPLTTGHVHPLAILLEVNKLPDLTHKSARDGELKKMLIRQMWELLMQPNALDLRAPKAVQTLSGDTQNRQWLLLPNLEVTCKSTKA